MQEKPTRDELQALAGRFLEGDATPELLAELSELHPADQADVLEELEPQESAALLSALPLDEAAALLEYVEEGEAADIAERMSDETLVALLDEMAADSAADLLADLDPARRELLLAAMDEEAAVRPLLAYADDTAGGLMVPLPFHLRATMTVTDALEALRVAHPDAELIYYLFVTDEVERLVGVVGLRRLVISPPMALIGTLMDREVHAVHADVDQAECARLLQRYALLALPVTDAHQRLLGFITVDDLVGVITEEAEAETLLLGGLSSKSDLFDTQGSALRKRLPWLYVNLLTAFLAAAVVNLFERTIARYAMLAIFQGIVAGQGGNAGTQTLTLMVRGLAAQEIGLRDAWELLRREGGIGLLQGLAVGIVVALVSFVWKGNARLALSLFVAMTGNLTMANLAGVGVPLLLERFGIDPAVASGVFVTTVTDVCGFFFFLGLATLLFPR